MYTYINIYIFILKSMAHNGHHCDIRFEFKRELQKQNNFILYNNTIKAVNL